MCGLYGGGLPVCTVVAASYAEFYRRGVLVDNLAGSHYSQALTRGVCGKRTVFPRFQHQSWKASRISSRASSTCFLKDGSVSISFSTFRIE